MTIIPLASSSSGNAHYISDGVTSLLLDAGLPLRELRRKLHEHKIFLSAVDFCLISHGHSDHCAGARELIKHGMPVYMSHGTARHLDIEGHWIIAPAGGAVTIGTFLITSFYVVHDAPEPLGFLIRSNKTHERLIYLTDTMYSPVRFPPLDVIMVECNYTAEALDASIAAGRMPIEQKPRLVKSHMSLDTLIKLLKANDLTKLKKIYVMHLSDRNSDEAQIRKEIQRLTGAEVIIC